MNLEIKVNSMFNLITTVRECDKYSQSVLVKFDKKFEDGDIIAADELYLTPDELETIGMFFTKRAKEIRIEQYNRNKE